jgi:hypothetical protein
MQRGHIALPIPRAFVLRAGGHSERDRSLHKASPSLHERQGYRTSIGSPVISCTQ